MEHKYEYYVIIYYIRLYPFKPNEFFSYYEIVVRDVVTFRVRIYLYIYTFMYIKILSNIVSGMRTARKRMVFNRTTTKHVGAATV